MLNTITYASLYVHYPEFLCFGKSSSYLTSNKEHVRILQKGKSKGNCSLSVPLKQVPLKIFPLPLEARGDRCVLRRVLLPGVRIVGGAACGRHRVSAGDAGSGRAEHTHRPPPVSVPYPADSCLVLTTENVLKVSFHVCFLAHRTGFLSATFDCCLLF